MEGEFFGKILMRERLGRQFHFDASPFNDKCLVTKNCFS